MAPLYRHYAIHVPWRDEDPPNQWTSDRHINRNGFLFVDAICFPKVHSVQSLGTPKQLLINKVVRGSHYAAEAPHDLRISTAAQGSVVQLPRPYLVNGYERIHFNELVCWQRFSGNHADVFSMYFKYCNGGSLQEFLEKYRQLGRAVPEHFVWLVAERLAEILRYFNYGTPPNPNREVTPAFWTLILGDFGDSALQTDPPGQMMGGVYNSSVVHFWEDIFRVGETLRKMCQTHIPTAAFRYWNDSRDSNEIAMNTVNGLLGPNERPYSPELIRMLQQFEFPGGTTGALITDTWIDNAGRTRMNWERMRANPAWVRDTMVPLARRKVRAYRGHVIPRGYWRQLDVSWTRPSRLMPFEYRFPEQDQTDSSVGRNNSSSNGSNNGSNIGSNNGSDSGSNNRSSIDRGDEDENKEGNDELNHRGSTPQTEESEQENEDENEDEEEEQYEDEEEEQDEDEERSELESEDVWENKIHRCPTPEFERNMKRLRCITVWEDNPSGNIRPPHRVVTLEFGVGSVLPINNDPPDLPPPPPLDDGASAANSNSNSSEIFTSSSQGDEDAILDDSNDETYIDVPTSSSGREE
ncbi:hypothetical protein F5Y05DRAFT_418458 [Hypoxylon sp. FL0543]|nr:hypothetical protein F5Y05DRAFT_418458 [Hypoxylon sp. FL0543]